MKFGIGSSARAKKYGFLKAHFKKAEFIKIIKRYNSKINLIDTAPSYGSAEKEIGKFSDSKMRIVTKISKIKSKGTESALKEIVLKIRKSLKNLNNKKPYALLFHDENDILFFKDNYFKKEFNLIKKRFLINKIGYSTYDAYNLGKNQKIYKFDIVQLPLNIFSINEKKVKYLKKIKLKYKIELHARSIFLQGIALTNLKIVPNNLKKKILLLKNFCNLKNINIYDFLISCLDNLKVLDYAIIGATSKNEYKNLIKYKFVKNINYVNCRKKFFIKNQKLIDPRYWKFSY